ncbi:MAG: hypothetical protein Q8L85_03590 [Alphaproteobacteria bacterium]|nr:hypothetical protein [Alphaproteobacteria bacterium]
MKKITLIFFAILMNISSSYATREDEITQRFYELNAEILACTDSQTANAKYDEFKKYLNESTAYYDVSSIGLNMSVALNKHIYKLSLHEVEQKDHIAKANATQQLQNNFAEIERRAQLQDAQDQAAIDAILAEFN